MEPDSIIFREPRFWGSANSASTPFADQYSFKLNDKPYTLVVVKDNIRLPVAEHPNSRTVHIDGIGQYVHAICVTSLAQKNISNMRAIIAGARPIKELLAGHVSDAHNFALHKCGMIVAGAEPCSPHDLSVLGSLSVLTDDDIKKLDYAGTCDDPTFKVQAVIQEIFTRVTGFRSYTDFLRSDYMKAC